MIKTVLAQMWLRAYRMNDSHILDLLIPNPNAVVVDLGCDDGAWTMQLADTVGTTLLHGVDIVPEQLAIAGKKGITTHLADLNNAFPLESGGFDVVHANQVIEHISHLDLFMSEIYRILKPGGYAIISTENASSWCNIFASIMGWQIFSLTNVSRKKSGIGNPLAVHRESADYRSLPSWTHKTIFNYHGLIEFCEAHGFRVDTIKGAGYFPLPIFFSLLDARHSHFLALRITKL